MFQFADIENHEGAETFAHGHADGCNQGCSLLNARCDQIRCMRRGDIAGRKVLRATGQMQAKKRQRPVDMQPAVLSDITTDGFAGLKAGDDIVYQLDNL
ncbi:hypothetical protein D3C87_1287210 [compost metagenome]